MELIGYADRWSVKPGERIRFMVSADVPSYDATIVRLIHGDTNPAGPGFKEEAIDTPATGRYPGRRQPVHGGSYVFVPSGPLLQGLASFTLQAWIYPTTPDRATPQGLLAAWSVPNRAGYALVLERETGLGLWIGDGHGRVEMVRAGRPLRPAQWYFVACSYDARDRRVRLYQLPLSHWPLEESAAEVERTVEATPPAEHSVPFLMAALWDGTGDAATSRATHLYNGKLESPCLFGRALQPGEIAALRAGAAMREVAGADVLAAWDFSLDMASARIVDTSGHGLHGQARNLPARAMTGHLWTGDELCFRHAPDQYGALYFHEDDLEDAAWEADIELTIPESLPSGVYAARLSAGESHDHVPFYVRPPTGAPSSPVAFLAPTMTYLAYANECLFLYGGLDQFAAHPGELDPRDRYLAAHPELARSLYDRHVDGTGYCYSSQLRPILTMRPDYRTWFTGAPSHFASDLYLIDWLAAKGFAHDVITDDDLHAEGYDLLAPYRVLITGAHPEYWTSPMMAALERYLAAGGRLMYLGGNGFYWVTSVDPQRPHVIEVRRGINGTRAWQSEPGEGYHSTSGEPGGLWRYRGKPPQKLVGVGFTAQGWQGAAGYRRQPGSLDPRAAFIFEGIGQDEIIGDFGLVLNGAAGDELDRLDGALGTPPHTLLLASSFGHDDSYQFVVEETLVMAPGQGGTQNPRVRADMTYFEGPNGGAVFAVGSINWSGSLSHHNYDNNVSRITENVLRRFMSEA